MRFDSYFELTVFIMGLRMIGYTAPFIDYKEDMINAGITKHIHLLKAKMSIENGYIVITFKDIDKVVYTIRMKAK